MRGESWGRFPRVRQSLRNLFWREDALRLGEIDGTVLPYGLGRSYGDVCLNEGGTLLVTRGLNRFISLSPEGVLRCEAGVSFAELLDICVPRGWFPPVTPGTKFVTVGGAIANDVHGKNHHRAGSFGCHVRQFELARSRGERLVCSTAHNPGWYAATIGGLGLTGLILWAEFQLIPIGQPWMDVEAVPVRDLAEALQLSSESEREFAYTVAWLDCRLGRGILMRGNHRRDPWPKHARAAKKIRIPVDLPEFVLNPYSIRLFNLAYYRGQLARGARRVEHYEPFFYPLDAVGDWNRIYGRSGFLQYQCLVPFGAEAAMHEILDCIARSGRNSFLTVLKTFGAIPSPGMMSFARPGITLALDFPNRAGIFELLATLDEIVVAAGGLVYPAKDARMSPRAFQTFYPRWEEFAAYVDPKFSSSFWRRVTAREG